MNNSDFNKFTNEFISTVIDMQINFDNNTDSIVYDMESFDPVSLQLLTKILLPIYKLANFYNIQDGVGLCIEVLGYGDGLWGKYEKDVIHNFNKSYSELTKKFGLSTDFFNLFLDDDDLIKLEFPDLVNQIIKNMY